ncbi:thioredoxin-like protein [Trametes gibbosa]|nr:thioredoxin-like protein [Trametes gibbosa]
MLAPIYRGWLHSSAPVNPRVSLSLRALSTTPSPSSSRPSAFQLKAMAAKDLVENTISENQIAIFSKSYCPFCKRAKALLTSKFPNVPTKIYELDEMDDGAAIQDYLGEKTGQSTVPNIFINQQHVGGCDAVVGLDHSGKLASLVSA